MDSKSFFTKILKSSRDLRSAPYFDCAAKVLRSYGVADNQVPDRLSTKYHAFTSHVSPDAWYFLGYSGQISYTFQLSGLNDVVRVAVRAGFYSGETMIDIVELTRVRDEHERPSKARKALRW